MKFITKKSLILFCTILLISSCKTSVNKLEKEKPLTFICGPCGGSCDELIFEKPGKCPHCGMKLIENSNLNASQKQKEISICFYLQDNVEVLDFAGPLEVFTAAGYSVFIVSDTKEPIKSQGTLKIIPEYNLENAPYSNVMAFFGGSHGKPTNDPEVISWIKSRKKMTKYYFSVCTGAFIMGKAGVLDNLTATTYHTQIKDLQKALPNTKVLPNVRFVDNGNVISTAGISAGIDGALHFVSKINGYESAKQIAEIIEYDKWEPNKGLIIK
jgi:transcriptional regulator GlxA family with amidase domain